MVDRLVVEDSEVVVAEMYVRVAVVTVVLDVALVTLVTLVPLVSVTVVVWLVREEVVPVPVTLVTVVWVVTFVPVSVDSVVVVVTVVCVVAVSVGVTLVVMLVVRVVAVSVGVTVVVTLVVSVTCVVVAECRGVVSVWVIVVSVGQLCGNCITDRSLAVGSVPFCWMLWKVTKPCVKVQPSTSGSQQYTAHVPSGGSIGLVAATAAWP